MAGAAYPKKGAFGELKGMPHSKIFHQVLEGVDTYTSTTLKGKNKSRINPDLFPPNRLDSFAVKMTGERLETVVL